MGWARLFVTVAARGVLFSILGMLTWALLPTVLGWTPTTVMTGSMEPRIHPGDVVVSRPAQPDATTLNHILLVDDPDHAGRLRLHRFAGFAPDGNLILRGDANSANDSTPVAPAAVHGVAVLRVPFVGLPVVWIADRNWGPLAAVLAAVAGLTLAAASGSSTPGRPEPRLREKTREMPRGPRRALQPMTSGAASASRRRRHPSAHRPQTVQTILAVAAVPVLVGAALMTASPAHAAFSAAAPTPASNFSALSSYPCLSDLPPAYLADKPSLFYAFQETSGPVTDASGNQQHGALNGTTTRVKGSCVRNDSPALTLDGLTGYVSTPTAVTSPNIFTVEIWFKTNTQKGGKLIGLGSSQTGLSAKADRHIYMTNTGAITFGVASENGDNGTVTITTPSNYRDNSWHLATATMSTTVMMLYIDGIQVANKSSVKIGPSYPGNWRVGYDTINTTDVTWPGAPTSLFFAGTIDNAAVYPAALTASQVKVHYDAGH